MLFNKERVVEARWITKQDEYSHAIISQYKLLLVNAINLHTLDLTISLLQHHDVNLNAIQSSFLSNMFIMLLNWSQCPKFQSFYGRSPIQT